MICFRFLLGLICLLSPISMVQAHQVPSVELEFQNLENHWRLLGEMDIAYMLPETRNIPGGPPLSREAVMKSAPQELARIRKETENTLRKLLRFTFAGKDVGWKIEFPDFEKEPFALPPEEGDIALISVRILPDQVPGGGELRAYWSGEQETELIVLIDDAEEEGQILSTLPGGNVLLLNVASVGQPPPPKPPASSGFTSLGFHHVIGPDHILFILGLFLLVPSWKALMSQSLLFTLAHSITLALAVFGLVRVSGVWVEHLIAISIAWVGIENLLTRKLGKQRLILVFCFGLLHGLGFATVLMEKLHGISGRQLAGPLIGFNVGVELAQIAVLAIAFLVLWPLKKWTFQVRTVGSAIIAIAGITWTVQRLFFPGSPLF